MERKQEQEGIRNALGSIMYHNGAKWFRFAKAILRNDADAEDVLQEAVRRVLARGLSFGSEEETGRYLGRAIYNAAMERYNLRKRERGRTRPLHEQATMPVASPFSWMAEIEKSKEKEEILDLLEDGLRLLPLKQCEALRITILDSKGLSIRDAGATNGIPYSTLRHRTRCGLHRLRRYLEARRRGWQPRGARNAAHPNSQTGS